MQKLGVLVVLIGFFLMFGNLTGIFPTFPFAGCLTVMLGGWIAKQGSS